MLYPDQFWSLLYDEYLPFSLDANHRRGVSYSELSVRTGLPVAWVVERVAAAANCIASGQKLAPPAFDRRATPRHIERDAA